MKCHPAFLAFSVVSIFLAACGGGDDAPARAPHTPTGVATVVPGGVVPWASLPLPAHPVKAAPSTLIPSLIAPPEVRAGDGLVFELKLTNRAGTPYEPADCPVYVAWLHTEDSAEPVNIAGEPVTLNCLPALPLPAGGEARFAMELRVPPSAPTGSWILSWGFAAPTGTYGTLANVPLRVLPR